MKLLVALAIIAAIWWLGQRRRASPRLSEAEARAVLAIGADAGPTEIAEAHRRLIARLHPDAGGSAALAVRVNEARDVLLRGSRPIR